MTERVIKEWQRYVSKNRAMIVVGSGLSHFSNQELTDNKLISIREYLAQDSIIYDLSTGRSKIAHPIENITTGNVQSQFEEIEDQFKDNQESFQFGTLDLLAKIQGVTTFISFARDNLLELALRRQRSVVHTISYYHNREAFAERLNDLRKTIRFGDTCLIYILGKYGRTSIRYAKGTLDSVAHFDDEVTMITSLLGAGMELGENIPSTRDFSEFLYWRTFNKKIIGLGLDYSHWEVLSFLKSLTRQIDQNAQKKIVFTNHEDFAPGYTKRFYSEKLSTTFSTQDPTSFLESMASVEVFNPLDGIPCFICYMRKSKALVDQLEERFKQQGINCWIDDTLKPDDNTKAIIKEKLNECSVYLLIISNEMIELELSNEFHRYPFSLREEWTFIMNKLINDSSKMVIPIFDNAEGINDLAGALYDRLVELSFVGMKNEETREKLKLGTIKWTDQKGFKSEELITSDNSLNTLLEQIGSFKTTE